MIASDRAPGAWRARVVTLALVGALLASYLTEEERWPLSAFRLFSHVRTAESWNTQLVAVSGHGSEHTIDLGRGRTAARSAEHQLSDLRRLPLDEQRAEVLAWLDVAGMDRSDFVAVRLYRMKLRRPPGDDEPPQVISRQMQVEVPL